MSTVSVHLPDPVHEKLRELAERDGISVDQFLARVAERVAGLPGIEYLEDRASRGSLKQLHAILDRVPHVPPDPGDEL